MTYEKAGHSTSPVYDNVIFEDDDNDLHDASEEWESYDGVSCCYSEPAMHDCFCHKGVGFH